MPMSALWRRILGKVLATPAGDERLGTFVSKLQITVFTVAPSADGWTVHDGVKQLNLFVSQRLAIEAVKNYRARLKAEGKRSSLVVRGRQQPPRRRSLR
jgi:hypothetical protein